MSKTEDKIKLTVKNLGKIEIAELEVGDLTIIAGENSAGKSYIVYSLWKALRQEKGIESFLNIIDEKVQKKLQQQSWNEVGSDVYKAFKSISENNNYTLDLGEAGVKTMIKAVIDSLVDEKTELLKHDLQQLFKDPDISGTVTLSSVIDKEEILKDRMQDYNAQKFKINIKDLTVKFDDFNLNTDTIIDPFSTSTMLTGIKSAIANELLQKFITYLEQTDEGNRKAERHNFLYSLYRMLMFHEVMSVFKKSIKNKVSLISSERTGAFLFWHDEADKADKSKAAEQRKSITAMSNFEDEQQARTALKDLNTVQHNNYSNYSEPVAENIKFVRELAIYANKEDAYINEKHPKIITELEKLMGGKLVYSDKRGVRFKPNDVEETIDDLPFHMLSSSIRSLSYIYFYVKHELEPGEILIIDEPEAYLHPENQMRMARILAMLVNAGIRVIITTHSDFMIREFNALIALGSLSKLPLDKERKSFKILKTIDNSMLLNCKTKAINVYGLIDGELSEKFPVNEHGLDLNTFDKAMKTQRKLMSAADHLVAFNSPR